MSTLSPNQKAIKYLLSLLSNAKEKEVKLPTESELADELHINRASAREALKTLQNIGLLNSSRGAGYTINNQNEQIAESFSELITLFLNVMNYTYKDIREIREALELKSVLLLQKQNISCEDINELYKYINNMKNDIDPRNNDLNFHRKLCNLTGNPLIRYVMKSLLDVVSPDYILIPWEEISDEARDDLVNAHIKVVEWLSSKDEETIIKDNPVTSHYAIADRIIDEKNKLYDEVSIDKLIKSIKKSGLTPKRIEELINKESKKKDS